MFEKLFTYSAVLKRHREGPLARERATYLERLASQGMAHETLLWRARYSLCVARELEGWPVEHRFLESDIDKLATASVSESSGERSLDRLLASRRYPRHWGCGRRMRRGAIEWTFIGWNEMRA